MSKEKKEKKPIVIAWKQQIHSGCPYCMVAHNSHGLSTPTQIHPGSYASTGTRMQERLFAPSTTGTV